MATAQTTIKPKTMAVLNDELERMHIRGQWRFDDEPFLDGPPPAGVPYLWKYNELKQKLIEACDAMPESQRARRNITLYNPGLNWRGTTQTLMMGMQLVMPGEVAWAHRHSIGALRFVIEGHEGLYTVVDGEVLPMLDNDLILTPAGAWHDHHNEGTKNGIWLDVLDVPLSIGLNQTFFEAYGPTVQNKRPRFDGYLSQRAGLLRPAWEQKLLNSFPLRYAWRDTERALQDFATSEGTPYDGIVLEYVNPANGGPTLPTMSCLAQMLPAGFETAKRRRTSSAVFYVIEGEGSTIVGDTEISWSTHDAFVVPNWSWHRHINRSRNDRAVLFSVTDEPLLSSIGLYREEPENTLRKSRLPSVPKRPSE